MTTLGKQSIKLVRTRQSYLPERGPGAFGISRKTRNAIAVNYTAMIQVQVKRPHAFNMNSWFC